jgi:alkylation response protein AidB-like acyl-CoA dehydrogenase
VRRLRAWQRKLAEARWVGITWPEEYGGRGAGISEQIVYVEEMARARAPEVIGNLGIGIAGPPILAYGSEEQKRRFAPRILAADDLWCFGFSEPGAGSDLASLRTQAVLEGDHFVVTGQKVWTTLGHHADWCMLLARTDPATRRARGISCLLVDMRSPGISVRPLRQITGEAEFNEIFFEGVKVPRANLLGELHEGWQIAVAALQNERGILYVVGMQIALKQARDKLIAFARSRDGRSRPGAPPGPRRTLPRDRGLPDDVPAHARQAPPDGDAGARGLDHQAPLDGAHAVDAADRDADPRPGGSALRQRGSSPRAVAAEGTPRRGPRPASPRARRRSCAASSRCRCSASRAAPDECIDGRDERSRPGRSTSRPH